MPDDPTDHAWPFPHSRERAVLTTAGILRQRPILYVTRDAPDGAWQFLEGGCAPFAAARVVDLGYLVDQDPSLRELADLPPGWGAWRDAVGASWHRVREDAT
jgi:hypothetical protein